MPPQARLTDMHACPLHVGGPIIGIGAPTVIVVGLPAARVTDFGGCPPPAPLPIPNPIVKGSMNVIILGLPAARIGDLCTHPGSAVTLGAPTVITGG